MVKRNNMTTTGFLPRQYLLNSSQIRDTRYFHYSGNNTPNIDKQRLNVLRSNHSVIEIMDANASELNQNDGPTKPPPLLVITG